MFMNQSREIKLGCINHIKCMGNRFLRDHLTLMSHNLSQPTLVHTTKSTLQPDICWIERGNQWKGYELDSWGLVTDHFLGRVISDNISQQASNHKHVGVFNFYLIPNIIATKLRLTNTCLLILPITHSNNNKKLMRCNKL